MKIETVTVPDMSTGEFLCWASEKVGHPMENFLTYMRPHMRDFMKESRGKTFRVFIEYLEDGGDMDVEEERKISKGNFAAFVVWALSKRPVGHSCTLMSRSDRLILGDENGEENLGIPYFFRYKKTKSQPAQMGFNTLDEYGFSRLTLKVVTFQEIKP